MDIKETVQKVLQELVLPDLGRMREGNIEILAKLDLTNNWLDDVNTHLANQSRRIDLVRSELSQRIVEVRTELSERIVEVRTELINRLDANNARIDRFFETSRATEYELRKIDDRVASLEHDVEDIRQRMAA